jgi:hypothetical protein
MLPAITNTTNDKTAVPEARTTRPLMLTSTMGTFNEVLLGDEAASAA